MIWEYQDILSLKIPPKTISEIYMFYSLIIDYL